MTKPPILENEQQRLVALKSYNILDTASDEDFDELASMASAICETPIALISLVDDNRQWFKSNIGLSSKETPKEGSFCAYAIASPDDTMLVYNANEDERFKLNPLVTGDPKIVFYAGVKLVNEDGFALGTLCVIDRKKKILNKTQINTLKILAKQVITRLELKRKIILVEKTNETLLEQNIFINKFASMAAHDIKTPITSILLASQLLKKSLKDIAPEQSIKLIDLNITVAKNLATLVEEMLIYSQSPATLLSKKESVNLPSVIAKVIAMVDVPESFEISLPEFKGDIEIASIGLEQIILNLLTNAIRYNDKELGTIKIEFTTLDELYVLKIIDNGIGISDYNLKRIFDNNFTIGGEDRFKNKGTGIGLSTVKELAKAMNGSISVTSELGIGSTFSIYFKK